MTAASAGDRTARANALVLAGAQAVVGAAAPIAIATGALAGTWLLLEDKSFATFPVTGYNIGVALAALPAAALMRAVGRRRGFITGSLITSCGGLVAAYALFAESFWLFAFALLMLGSGGAFVQQYRFAATDGASDAYRSRAISLVLAGGVFAAVIGPQTVRYFGGLFHPTQFAGAFVGVFVLGLVGAAILSRLKLPPAPDGPPPEEPAAARALPDIVRQPRFLAGLVCGVGTYATMSFIMTGAPLAIVGHGHSQDVGILGIQWHVLAMFAPSFFTGRLIARFGKFRIVATGLVLLGLSAGVALHGPGVAEFWTSLVLLGLGWNFGFIGSTAIVADTYRACEKNKTQGFHDFILFGAVAFASFMSGQVYVASGWETMNVIVFPVVTLCLALLGLVYRLEGALRPAS